MNLQFYLEKLFASSVFENFMKENPRAFLCSGFFVVDSEGKDNKFHLDYFSEGKLFSFQLEKGVEIVPTEFVGNSPEQIADNTDFDFSVVEKVILEEMEKQAQKHCSDGMKSVRIGEIEAFEASTFVAVRANYRCAN